MNTNLLVLSFTAAILSGCANMPAPSSMATSSYLDNVEKPPIATSLFPSDRAVLGDEAVARILSSKLELPAKARLALMKFPGSESGGSRYYGSYYWRNEDYQRIQQAQIEALSAPLISSDRVAEVTPLPSLMIPQQISIPVLREAAVRLQADLLLVFRIGSDTYSQYRTFAKDKVKAYSTCEVVILDVRTGLVPFTRVISREREESKQPSDLDVSETRRRAEQASALDALRAAADELVNFLKKVPKKSG